MWQILPMKRICAVLVALTLSSPAVADAPMSGAEFEAYTTGKTLFFSSNGTDYGIEEYFNNRRVRWSFLDGECQEGTWYESGDLICFIYEYQPDNHQCWTFTQQGDGLFAKFLGDENSTELYETRKSEEPLQCLGPKIGV